MYLMDTNQILWQSLWFWLHSSLEPIIYNFFFLMSQLTKSQNISYEWKEETDK